MGTPNPFFIGPEMHRIRYPCPSGVVATLYLWREPSEEYTVRVRPRFGITAQDLFWLADFVDDCAKETAIKYDLCCKTVLDSRIVGPADISTVTVDRGYSG